MTNLQRLQMEIKGIELDQSELLVYLSEHELEGHKQYNTQYATNKKQIYATALSILESLANNPTGTIRVIDWYKSWHSWYISLVVISLLV